MKRVMVIGGPGSGKSTLARRLHAMTGLPLLPLWTSSIGGRDGSARPKDEWERLMAELAAREEWIMDGGYDSTFHIRMPRADTILWLDLPRRIAFPRVLKRIALGYGRVRADAAPGCPEWLRLGVPALGLDLPARARRAIPAGVGRICRPCECVYLRRHSGREPLPRKPALK